CVDRAGGSIARRVRNDQALDAQVQLAVALQAHLAALQHPRRRARAHAVEARIARLRRRKRLLDQRPAVVPALALVAWLALVVRLARVVRLASVVGLARVVWAVLTEGAD